MTPKTINLHTYTGTDFTFKTVFMSIVQTCSKMTEN